MKRNERGITLIALVVTIVVLLILAGVSISMLTGENGIITQAQGASIKNDNGTVLEGLRIKLSEYLSENEGKYAKDKLELLRDDNIIDENNIVNVEELLKQRLKTGNGSNNKDVYVIEENNLYYYDKKGNKTDVGDLGSTEESIPETDHDLFEITDDGTISLKYYDDYYHDREEFPVEDLVIPKKVNGIIVKKISEDFLLAGHGGIFSDTIANRLKSVTIPDTVVEIGENAFRYCISLTNVIIPKSVTSIGNSAFVNCSSLTDITIPGSVIKIGERAFSWCGKLINITISEGVELIEGNAFSFCSNLTNITIPKSVTSIGENTFWSCDNLRKITILRDENGEEISGAPWGAEEYIEIEYINK